MKSLKLLLKQERKHYMKCKCGEYFDMRSLSEVMKHLHKSNAEKQQNTKSLSK